MFDSSRPGELVESAPPRVTLRNAFAHPFDSAIAAARTCYAPRLITPEEITDKQRLNVGDFFRRDQARGVAGDRKSTRLNSSHGYISYAVFCLKKKKPHHIILTTA